MAISYLPEEQQDADKVVALIEQAGRTAVALPGDLTDRDYCRTLVEQTVETLDELSDEQFDETFTTNVYAMFWITKAALPHLKPGSTIINTFSKGLSQQLASRGIRVNVVGPGPIWTPPQTAGGQPPEALPEFGGQTPLGRAGQPAELAPAFVFMAAAESSYVTGATIHVNGGIPTP